MMIGVKALMAASSQCNQPTTPNEAIADNRAVPSNKKQTPQCLKNAIVTVDLDGQAKPVNLPPKREIPRKQRQQKKSETGHACITRVTVLPFVLEHQLALLGWHTKHPARHHDHRSDPSHHPGTEILRNQNVPTMELRWRPRGAVQTEPQVGAQKDRCSGQSQHHPARTEERLEVDAGG